MKAPYCPKRGDVVWISFHPQAGHEQAGHRPALTLSPESYNRTIGLAVFLPISTKVKGYPFEVALPSGLKATGVVLADQAKSFDWRARGARYCCSVPETTLTEVVSMLDSLLRG